MSRNLPPEPPSSFALNLSGRYKILNWYDREGRQREFACRTLNISPWSMVLAAPVIGTRGRRVLVNLEQIGEIEGSIAGAKSQSFELAIDAPEARRADLEHMLRWLKTRQDDGLLEKRSGMRTKPSTPHSTVLLHNGTVVPCFVIDMSPTGVAVSANFDPQIGQPLAVGKVVGRVIRRFAEGFAVQFLKQQDAAALESLLIRAP